jgi:hypothetical protein
VLALGPSTRPKNARDLTERKKKKKLPHKMRQVTEHYGDVLVLKVGRDDIFEGIRKGGGI